MCVANGPFVLNSSRTTITFCESQPTVVFGAAPTSTPTPTETPIPTSTETPTPTETPIPTPTQTPTPTPTPTATPILYLNCYTVRQYLYNYTGGGGNSALYVLTSDYPDVSTIPVGATATINGSLRTVTSVSPSNAVYFNGGSGYVINFNPNSSITSGIS